VKKEISVGKLAPRRPGKAFPGGSARLRHVDAHVDAISEAAATVVKAKTRVAVSSL